MHPDDDNALNTEEKIWDLTMQINLKGVWWGCKYAILAMRENPEDETKGLHTGGSIINTASFVASVGAATPQLACKLTVIPCRFITGARFVLPRRYCVEGRSTYRVSCKRVSSIHQGAVLAMTRELAMVHAREGIRFNSVSP